MLCAEIEQTILDYQDGRLSPNNRREVESHLNDCAACRTLARQMQHLDQALTNHVHAPVLSAEFDRRLQERIHSNVPPLSAPARAERKRQMQAEFAAGTARLRRNFFGFGTVFSQLLWPLAATLAGWLVWVIAAPMVAQLDVQGGSGPLSEGLRCLVASVVFLTVALAEKSLRPGWSFRW